MKAAAFSPSLLLLLALTGVRVEAFVAVDLTRSYPPSFGISLTSRHDRRPKSSSSTPPDATAHASLRRQRGSVAIVQASGLFGLGAAEIAIIAVAAAFLLGPQKLAELGRDAGKVAGELKDVPKEFQKGFSAGLDEGETEARSRKAKPMTRIPPEIEKGSSEPDDSTPP
jgi:Sec-independent protein translocase protein TatA